MIISPDPKMVAHLSGTANGAGAVDGSVPVPVEPTVFELSSPGRTGFSLPTCDVPARPLDELIPASLQRGAPAALPELSELQVVRHFTRLSQLNYSIDRGFHPFGACTLQ